MTLAEWKKNEWLVEHLSRRQEINHLFRLIERDLKDCRNKELSLDWRFNIAYNAALQCANDALAAEGFRAAKDSHHFRVIQSLKFTLEIIERRINKATFKVKKGEDPIDGCSRAEAAESPSPRGSLWTARP